MKKFVTLNEYIIDFTDDDGIISAYIAAAISYAESYQHLERNYYRNNEMRDRKSVV